MLVCRLERAAHLYMDDYNGGLFHHHEGRADRRGWPSAGAARAAVLRNNQALTSTTELSVPCWFQTFSWAIGSGIHSPSATNLY